MQLLSCFRLHFTGHVHCNEGTTICPPMQQDDSFVFLKYFLGSVEFYGMEELFNSGCVHKDNTC